MQGPLPASSFLLSCRLGSSLPLRAPDRSPSQRAADPPARPTELAGPAHGHRPRHHGNGVGPTGALVPLPAGRPRLTEKAPLRRERPLLRDSEEATPGERAALPCTAQVEGNPAPLTQRMRLSQSWGFAGFASMAAASSHRRPRPLRAAA